MLRPIAPLLLAAVALCAPALAQDVATDLTPELRTRLGVPEGPLPQLVPAGTSADAGHTAEQAARNAPDILRVDVAHLGGQRLLFAVTFSQRPDFIGATFIIYVDADNNPDTGRQDQYHGGVDFMLVATSDQVSLSSHNPANAPGNTIVRAARVGAVLYVTVDTALPDTDPLPIGVHLLSQREGGESDSTRHQVVQLPRSVAAVPELPRGSSSSLRTAEDFRYVDDLVRYEKLADKGLRSEQVAPQKPFQPGRPCPEPLFTTTPRHPGKAGSLTRTRVPVSLLEETGTARPRSPVSFGFPCPQGGVFDPAYLRVLEGDREVPAQFTITAFWPDGSLKWVLVDFLADFAANEDKTVTVEVGGQVDHAPAGASMRLEDIDRLWPEFLTPIGMELRDETGAPFLSSKLPERTLVLEQTGPVKAVVRSEGCFTSSEGAGLFRYVCRLTFWAGSKRVQFAWTTVNDHLATEFTDITSLTLPLFLGGRVRAAKVSVVDAQGKLQMAPVSEFSLLQTDDQTCALQTARGTEEVGRAPGVVRVQAGEGIFTLAVQDFWQRWPKGLSLAGDCLSLDLLPPQPGPDFGAGLPHYLLYNLCEGKYRFKWGMSFTERFTLDFGAKTTAEALYADVNQPVVAVIPAAWYAETRALGRVAPPLEKQFAVWDKWVADAFQANMRVKERDREYGFLNYGDWYGERGRNWGNNEYDYAHGLFQDFLRTGNRDHYRWALTAARHQAEVDLVHAYPDGFYVGGQVPHSVGHTGAWSEQLERGTWQARYDSMVTAANGHNWADGMVDAWCLSGDAGVMHSALLYGEHVAWAMSPTFTALGTHERSAGWSLKAIMALYNQTYDPEYLAAAKRIAGVALKEQDLAGCGAWPHVLPLDHANGRANVVGNNLFLIGVLLGGLQAYAEVVQDPAVDQALIAGVRWVAKSWDESAGGWPYSATPEGMPLYPATTSLNMLIVQPVAYVAKLTGDEALWRIVDEALAAVAVGGADSFGKSVAQKLHFAGGTLALLQEHYARTRSDKGASALSGDAAWFAAMMARTPAAKRHSVRAPDEKIFWVELQTAEAELVCTRSPHGAMTKRSPTGTLQVTDTSGQVIGEDTFSTDGPHEYRVKLAGQPGNQFRVLVNDDQRGVWTLTGAGLRIVMQTSPGFRIGGVGSSRYWFFVPEATAEFRLKLLGVHTGGYGAVVLTPGGQVAGQHQDINPGPALIQGAAPGSSVPATHPERGEIIVQPEPAETGKLWSVVLRAAGDIGVELVGIPPFLSLGEEAWFQPLGP